MALGPSANPRVPAPLRARGLAQAAERVRAPQQAPERVVEASTCRALFLISRATRIKKQFYCRCVTLPVCTFRTGPEGSRIRDFGEKSCFACQVGLTTHMACRLPRMLSIRSSLQPSSLSSCG